ncbi:hypothetical protein F9B85_07720 [Heliorestis acidaminivorans]|uniref:Uncharacterized protein n=1 Tax=Heliorestis acidaminivorans TaxID=553427 RepID=A0A6I0ES07_9FIRM|nr:hypothetical protein [Heliorestis acidaminivorans]KAB2952545.1 hypothetical protein F9B85_07720 [Heliorestis acidaminivorans]
MSEKTKSLVTYRLDQRSLEELYKKYGRPGETAPGVKAPRKRNIPPPQQEPGAVPLLETD